MYRYSVESYIKPWIALTSDFAIPQVKSVSTGSNSNQYLGTIIWNLIPNEIKYRDLLDDFL